MKRCCTCGEEKPLDDFYRNRARKDGHAENCISCSKVKGAASYERNRAAVLVRQRERRAELRLTGQDTPQNRWRAANPDKVAAMKLRQQLKRYGLTVAQYQAMMEDQEGVCAICREAPATDTRLQVDHDHDTGVVRGLVCRNCNLLVAYLEIHGAHLDAALTYIERSRYDDEQEYA